MVFVLYFLIFVVVGLILYKQIKGLINDIKNKKVIQKNEKVNDGNNSNNDNIVE